MEFKYSWNAAIVRLEARHQPVLGTVSVRCAQTEALVLD